LSSPIRRHLPLLIVGLSISLIIAGAYAEVGFASLTVPKAVWTINPLTIKFSGNGGRGTGSASDPFKCAPAVTSPVTLRSSVSNPIKISLFLGQTSFATCGQLFNPLTLTVHCLVATCSGTYTATITVTQGYSTIPPNLAVTIVVA
jgi:hypothetical protein